MRRLGRVGKQVVRNHLVTVDILVQHRELTPGKDAIQIHGLPVGRVRSSSAGEDAIRILQFNVGPLGCYCACSGLAKMFNVK